MKVARKRGSEDAAQKLQKNVPGKYFTTDECDGCAYCAAVAPENFEFEKTTNTYFVGRQPASTDEEEVVREAMDDCPVDAIRSDDEDEEADNESEVELHEKATPWDREVVRPDPLT